MKLLDRIKRDAQRFTSNSNEFGCEVTITTRDGITSATVNAITTKHHLGVSTDGNMVNALISHFTVSEKLLNDAGFVTRDLNNKVNIKGFRTKTVFDTVIEEFEIKQVHPDEKLGLILCILGEYKP